MQQPSNPYMRWVSALLPISLLLGAGCKEGSTAAVEPGASSVQKEDAATIKATVKANLDEAPTQRIAAGDNAPDFELPSSMGGTVALRSVLKESAVALVFYRSAVW